MSTANPEAYAPAMPSQSEDAAAYAYRELYRIAAYLEALNLGGALPVTNVAPDKTRDGMIRYADGTNWNPGSGEGIYAYYNSTWNKL